MPKVSTDEKLIEKFLSRGVENVYPTPDALRKVLISGKRLRAYQGFDPTGPHLHIGHAIGIRGLRILQQLGHEVIFLVGDFTARIGDPDKTNTREILTPEKIEQNMAGWKKQAAKIIDFNDRKNPVRFEHNYKWLSKLKLDDLLQLMSKITVQQMLERDLFERRLKEKNPVRLQEFVYPLMQGYDSVAMNVDIEIGGADQTFNMLVGRDLVRSYLGKEKFVRTNVMMEAPDSQTMSKTKGNGINLADDAKTMFGKTMSYSDDLIIKAFELLTDVGDEEIGEIRKELKKGANPRDAKARLAYEIAKIYHGEKSAKEAEEEFNSVFSRGNLPSEIPEIEVSEAKLNLADLVIKTGFARSKSEAQRLIDQKAVKIDNKTITNRKADVEINSGMIIQVGKRNFARIR